MAANVCSGLPVTSGAEVARQGLTEIYLPVRKLNEARSPGHSLYAGFERPSFVHMMDEPSPRKAARRSATRPKEPVSNWSSGGARPMEEPRTTPGEEEYLFDEVDNGTMCCSARGREPRRQWEEEEDGYEMGPGREPGELCCGGPSSSRWNPEGGNSGPLQCGGSGLKCGEVVVPDSCRGMMCDAQQACPGIRGEVAAPQSCAGLQCDAAPQAYDTWGRPVPAQRGGSALCGGNTNDLTSWCAGGDVRNVYDPAAHNRTGVASAVIEGPQPKNYNPICGCNGFGEDSSLQFVEIEQPDTNRHSSRAVDMVELFDGGIVTQREVRPTELLETTQFISKSSGMRCCDPNFVRVDDSQRAATETANRIIQAISPHTICSNVGVTTQRWGPLHEHYDVVQ